VVVSSVRCKEGTGQGQEACVRVGQPRLRSHIFADIQVIPTGMVLSIFVLGIFVFVVCRIPDEHGSTQVD